MELLGETAHPSYRLFLSAEPAATVAAHIIPQVRILRRSVNIGILERNNTGKAFYFFSYCRLENYEIRIVITMSAQHE